VSYRNPPPDVEADCIGEVQAPSTGVDYCNNRVIAMKLRQTDLTAIKNKSSEGIEQ
jgi:hypothetical protein